MRKLVLTLLALVVAVPLHAQERWELSKARVSIRLNAGLVRDIGIRVGPAARVDGDGYATYAISTAGQMIAVAPNSIYTTVDMGEFQLTGGPTFSWRGDSAPLRGARIVPGALPNTFIVMGADGQPLFNADHQHFQVDRRNRSLRMYNMDLRLSAELAARLGEPRHAGLAVGVLEVNVAANIPRGAVERPDGACINPEWGNPDNDVALIILSPIQQVARDNATGAFVVAISPSATLKNVGVTDVPWQVKFSPPAPPYNTDQHPYLVWNLYRVANGRLEQIGASGLKHAFTSTNSNCGCPGGNVLWVGNGGCEDTYGVSTNNSTGSLGPRSEINAHTGVWQRCGSIFDPDCNGIQNNPPGFAGAADRRRLTVLESELQTPGAQYYFDGWYVVRDDVNIFNTMAYRAITPSFNISTWSFTATSAHTPGAVINAWVNPSNPGPNADNQRLSTIDGHLTLAVKATSVGGGRWRYDYAVMNHDYDNGITTFAVALPAGAVVTNTYFHDADRNPTTDWVPVVTPGLIRFEPPQNARTPVQYFQDWGMLNTFSFEVNAAPTGVAGAQVTLGVLEGVTRTITAPIMGPTP